MALIPVISKFNVYQQIRLLLRKWRDGTTPDAALLNDKLRIISALSLDAPDGQVKSMAGGQSQSGRQAGHACSTPCTGSRTVHNAVLFTHDKARFLRMAYLRFVGNGGALLALAAYGFMTGLHSPSVMISSNQVWPGNPFFSRWRQQLEKSSAMFPVNDGYEQLHQQLGALEVRLLDAEQKRKPYLSISELKTAVYQMQHIVESQKTMFEYQLYALESLQARHQPLSVSRHGLAFRTKRANRHTTIGALSTFQKDLLSGRFLLFLQHADITSFSIITAKTGDYPTWHYDITC